MSHALALNSRDFAAELRSVLHDLDPIRWRIQLEDHTREALAVLRNRLDSLTVRVEEVGVHPNVVHLHDQLVELASLMDRLLPSPGQRAEAMKKRWEEYRCAMESQYERIAASLSAFDIHVPSLRSTNHLRSLWHAMNGLVVLLVMKHVFMTREALIAIALSFSLVAWSLEWGRRKWPGLNRVLMSLFRYLAHPHEAWKVNSGTWYCTAMLILAALGHPISNCIAVIVLGFADPAAALVGRRFGKVQLVNGRSLEGSLSFVLVAMLSSLSVLWIYHPPLSFLQMSVLSLSAGLVGALAELFCRRIDDNLAIPVSVALVVGGLIEILGIQ